MSDDTFEHLIAEAEEQPFSGWNFSYLDGRMHHEHVSWDYGELVRHRLSTVDAVLDIGTGGGEFLASLVPLSERTVATEAYPPNVRIARRRLAPLSVEVVAVEEAPGNVNIDIDEGAGTMPFPDASFPLVINRHTSYYPREIGRMLQRGGSFITQQVGGEHYQEVNQLLGATPGDSSGWNLPFATRQLDEAGLQIVDGREERPDTVFSDIGALIYYLRAVPWQVPDFTVERYRDRLAPLHERMVAEGGLRVQGHLFYLEAVSQ